MTYLNSNILTSVAPFRCLVDCASLSWLHTRCHVKLPKPEAKGVLVCKNVRELSLHFHEIGHLA